VSDQPESILRSGAAGEKLVSAMHDEGSIDRG